MCPYQCDGLQRQNALDDRCDLPCKLWGQAANPVFENYEVARIERVIFEHEVDFGVDDGTHMLDDVENESRPPGQRFVQ